MATTKPELSTAHAQAREQVTEGRGTCQVCGREVTCSKDTGMPSRTHNQRIVHRHKDDHGPEIAHDTPCHGSRLPVKEWADVFDKARLKRG